MKKSISVALLLLLVQPAFSAVQTETVTYKDGKTVLKGYLAWDDAVSERRPGVLVVHEWYGLNDYAKRRTREIAELGYVAFAADIYGGGKVAADTAEAGKLAGIYKGDRALMRRRARAALDSLAKNSRVDADRLAATGYCFGGTTALELARSGAPLKATISFHGGLDTPDPADARKIKGLVVALHGADDPYVPAKEVAAFEDEMRAGNVDWELVSFGNAVHAFTNPAAGDDNSKGAAYNEKADRRSWDIFKITLADALK